ncbi:MAG: hypothetical protein N3A38_09030, partial [Planctomycetota bacterium]|nr:hypothetical protein [Planctomycetota bacterium]
MPGTGGRGRGGGGGGHGGLHGAKKLAETGPETTAGNGGESKSVTLDPAIARLLASCGIKDEEVLVCAEGDLSKDDRFGRRA